jgi:predicted O-methyltransferase YrrM
MANRNLFHVVQTALSDPSACALAYVAIRRYHAVQRLWELTRFVGKVRDIHPRTIVEIGTHMGGTLHCWSRILPPDGKLVSLDLPNDPNEPRTTVTALEKIVPASRRCIFIRGDSHASEIKIRLLESLEGRPVDFLFIDGDHAYEGVKMDFEMYRNLVRPGGLIAFHDIVPNPEAKDYGVAKFWQEVKTQFQTEELIDPHPVGPTGMGIGLVRI